MDRQSSSKHVQARRPGGDNHRRGKSAWRTEPGQLECELSNERGQLAAKGSVTCGIGLAFAQAFQVIGVANCVPYDPSGTEFPGMMNGTAQNNAADAADPHPLGGNCDPTTRCW